MREIGPEAEWALEPYGDWDEVDFADDFHEIVTRLRLGRAAPEVFQRTGNDILCDREHRGRHRFTRGNMNHPRTILRHPRRILKQLQDFLRKL